MRKLGSLALVAAISLSAIAWVGAPAHAARLKRDLCTLRVSIAHPHPRQYEILTVKSTVAKTRVRVTIRYKTVSHIWKITTGASRRAKYRFNVGHPTKNYRVTLSGKVVKAPKGRKTGATCRTNFVPV